MYNAEPYVLTDAIKANVTELYFGSDADWLEEADLIQRIYRDCEFLKEKLKILESERNKLRKDYMRLKYSNHTTSKEEES